MLVLASTRSIYIHNMSNFGGTEPPLEYDAISDTEFRKGFKLSGNICIYIEPK